jgi:glutamate/tyrosine decarboxylase-like PLP-dependent enzyme
VSLLDKESLRTLRDALDRLEAGFSALPSHQRATGAADEDVARVLREVADRLHDNYPYFHPLYAGQMLKPPHPVARVAYALAMWINPNNHALDGGRASSAMEREAIAEIARMFGWETHLGHLCGGGTMANLEALWVARESRPGETVVASSQAHYTHQRISGVLGIDFEAIPCDRFGRMDVEALARRLEASDKGGNAPAAPRLAGSKRRETPAAQNSRLEPRESRPRIGTVVATMGATATGAVDPLPLILELRERYGFRVHADAAYGGYFTLTETLAPETRRAFDRLAEVDSIVIDPHKHGLQPYGCGCVLFRDPSAGRFYKHDSPYTYFSSTELHLGEISLECSRPGAAAVGLWATQRLLPLVRGGDFARGLESGRAAALALHDRVRADARFVAAFRPELDIVIFAPRAPRVSEASAASRRVFDEAARRGLHLAVAELPIAFFDLAPAIARDRETITCLRSVMMKPEHHDWIDRIWKVLCDATDAAAAVR